MKNKISLIIMLFLIALDLLCFINIATGLDSMQESNNNKLFTIIRDYKLEIKEREVSEYIGDYKVTYYCPCEKCCGKWALSRPKDKNGNDIIHTASGEIAKSYVTTACDPSIPFGTKLKAEFENGEILYLVCEDRGGAISGKHIDIYIDNHEECCQKGVDMVKLYIIKE